MNFTLATYFQHKIIFNLRSEQLIDTGDFMYILPPYRFTSYAIGLSAGYFLRRLRDVKVSSTQLCFLWTMTLSVFSMGIRLAAELCEENYEYNRVHAAVMTLLPIPFCAIFVLLIFTAELNYSSKLPHTSLSFNRLMLKLFLDFITNFLQWNGFRVTTRLSYNFYLVQFMVFYYNTGTARGATFYTLIKTGVRNFKLQELHL